MCHGEMYMLAFFINFSNDISFKNKIETKKYKKIDINIKNEKGFLRN